MTDRQHFAHVTPGSTIRYISFGPYQVDLRTEELRKDGVRLKLAGQPFQILVLLLSRPGDLVSRDELQRQLWADDTFTDWNHGLNAAINKLRETLNDTAAAPQYIETLPRRGYRFIAPVRSDFLAEDPVAIVPPVPSERVEPPTPYARAIYQSARVALALLAITLVGSVVVSLINRQSKIAAVPAYDRFQLLEDEARARKSSAKLEDNASQLSGSKSGFVPTDFREPGVLQTAPVFRTVISGQGGNAAPQFSPDGKHIAFMSNRSGPWQIWVSNVDGSNPVQVSFTDSAGTPRWSPDGRSIAFDAPSSSGTSIFITSLDGSRSYRELAEGRVPSFSRDGRSIYFASGRSGNWQVWKVSVNGGPPEMITNTGGFAALESRDGYLYYSKSPDRKPEICRVLISGGVEDCTLPEVRPRTWSSWAVTRVGILFAEDLPDGRFEISLYEPEKGKVRDLVSLQAPPVWMSASIDGGRAIMNDIAEQRISVVDNLR